MKIGTVILVQGRTQGRFKLLDQKG